MPTIVFIDYLGVARKVNADEGDSVMQSAKRNDIPGIDADCGGAGACATCHVIVDDAWSTKLDAPDDLEFEMLDCVADRMPTSRLSCQIKITMDLDGLTVATPESQN